MSTRSLSMTRDQQMKRERADDLSLYQAPLDRASSSNSTSQSILSLLALSLLPLALLTVSIISSPAHATIALRATPESLAEQSDLIVRARVVKSEVLDILGPRGEVFTDHRLEVIEYWRGAGASTLTLRQLGGTLNGETLHIEGDARLSVGQEFIFFLIHDPSAPVEAIVSLAQGVYLIDATEGHGDPFLIQDLRGISFYAPVGVEGAGQITPGVMTRTLTLSVLKAQVQAYLNALKASSTSSARQRLPTQRLPTQRLRRAPHKPILKQITPAVEHIHHSPPSSPQEVSQ